MKKIDLGQGAQILANIGVIAGIVFLAVELRQNKKTGVEPRFSKRIFEPMGFGRRCQAPGVAPIHTIINCGSTPVF